MKTMRQDAWSTEDDERLASIVLRHIREGSTQLSAFEEGAELLGRTAAACGYRWNACVRKLHLPTIDLAKLERKEHKEEKDSAPEVDVQTSADGTTVTWNAVLRFLKQFRHDSGVLQVRVRQLEREAETERLEGDRLRRERLELQQKFNQLSQEHEVISEDHRALLQIVERARRRSFAGPLDAERESNGAATDGDSERTDGERTDGGAAPGDRREAPVVGGGGDGDRAP